MSKEFEIYYEFLSRLISIFDIQNSLLLCPTDPNLLQTQNRFCSKFKHKQIHICLNSNPNSTNANPTSSVPVQTGMLPVQFKIKGCHYI